MPSSATKIEMVRLIQRQRPDRGIPLSMGHYVLSDQIKGDDIYREYLQKWEMIMTKGKKR